jgi:hypothetical protein
MAQIELLELDDNRLRSLAADPRVLQLIPCFVNVRRTIDRVGAAPPVQQCCRKQTRTVTAKDAIAAGYACLNSAPKTAKNTLKETLGARFIRFRYTNERGMVVVVTF